MFHQIGPVFCKKSIDLGLIVTKNWCVFVSNRLGKKHLFPDMPLSNISLQHSRFPSCISLFLYFFPQNQQNSWEGASRVPGVFFSAGVLKSLEMGTYFQKIPQRWVSLLEKKIPLDTGMSFEFWRHIPNKSKTKPPWLSPCYRQQLLVFFLVFAVSLCELI